MLYFLFLVQNRSTPPLVACRWVRISASDHALGQKRAIICFGVARIDTDVVSRRLSAPIAIRRDW
jgi:hypothetical protein